MLIALLAVCAGAVAQSVAGFGFALICGSVLIATLGQTAGLRLIVTMSTLVSAAILATTCRHVKLRDGLLLAAPGVVLAPLLVWLLHGANRDALTVAAGVVTLASAGALASGLRLTWLRGVGGAVGAGAISALMNVLGGMSGPAAALYAVNAGWPQNSIRPTLQVFGSTLNIATLVSIGGPALDWRTTASLLLGWLIGTAAARVLPEHWSRRVVLLVIAAGGVFAIGRGIR